MKEKKGRRAPFYQVIEVDAPEEFTPKTSARQFNIFKDSNIWKDFVYLIHKRRAITQATLEDGSSDIRDVDFARGQLQALKFVENAMLIELADIIRRKETKEANNARRS